MPINGHYSIEEAADYLGVPVRRLRWHLYESKLLPQGIMVSGIMYWTKEQLDDFAVKASSATTGHNMDDSKLTPRMFIEQNFTDVVAGGAATVTYKKDEIISLSLGQDGYYDAVTSTGEEIQIWRNALLIVEWHE